MMGHVGKKLLFMGQEFAQLREWSEERELDWYLLAEPEHQAIQNWVRDLLHLYKNKKAMYEADHELVALSGSMLMTHTEVFSASCVIPKMARRICCSYVTSHRWKEQIIVSVFRRENSISCC